MKKIGFIGSYDKTDLIIYIAKILTVMGKKVIVIDSTINQKAKYIVPVINPTTTYVTEYEDMDVAVGFKDFDGIKEYLGMPLHAELTYDYALIDTDNVEVLENFTMKTANKNYFITSFDVFSLKRGLEILSGIKEPMKLTKILFSKYVLKEEDDYLNFLALGYKIVWDNDRIYFPFELGDQSVIIENQRVSKIKFKKLSNQYKESLVYITEQIAEEVNLSEIRKAMKRIEKGV